MDLDALTEVDVFNELIDRLGRLDPSALIDPDSVVAVQRGLAKVEAFVTTVIGAFDESGTWALDGARTASSWVTHRCRIPRSVAARQVRRARNLRTLPEFAGAWADGGICGSHVDAVISLRCPETEQALARDEALLADQAQKLTFDQFKAACGYWMQCADPVAADQAAERRRARRDVYLVQGVDSQWIGGMNLDPISGATVAGELERLEAELFEADLVEARERLGRDPVPADLSRTPGQRRADALVEMATRSKSCPADTRRPAPLFTVLVGWETLHGRICQLEDGTVVPPRSLLPWLGEADLERATFNHDGTRVGIGARSKLSSPTSEALGKAVFGPQVRIDIPPTARLFTGATRRAIEVRDRQCTHPFCDKPAPSCQADHIQPWAMGGLTTQENGRLLCAFHNGLRNQRPAPAD